MKNKVYINKLDQAGLILEYLLDDMCNEYMIASTKGEYTYFEKDKEICDKLKDILAGPIYDLRNLLKARNE